MDKTTLIAKLSPESKGILKREFDDAKDLFYSLSAELFEEDRLYLLEDLINQKGFQKFLNKRKNSGQGRLEGTLYTLLRRCLLEIPSSTISKIAEEMCSPQYRKIASTFYLIPIDKEGYEVFERGFFTIGEQNLKLLSDYLTYCSTDRWTLFRTEYKPMPEVFQDLFIKLINHLLVCKDINQVMEYTKYLLEPSISRFIYTAFDMENWQDFNMNFFLVLETHYKPIFFLNLIKTFVQRYPERNISNKDVYERKVYKRLISLWDVMWILKEDQYTDFKKYLHNYGDMKDELQTFVWDEVLNLEIEKIPQIYKILNSDPFLSIRRYYGSDTYTQKFLIKNIINAVAELAIKRFETKLYKIVLKLLLTLKVERNFLKRRSHFFDWLKCNTNSQRVEMEFMRMTFYEYIFISIGQVPNEMGMKMTRFCDEDHQFVCRYLDTAYMSIKRRIKDINIIFLPILERLRICVFRPFKEKFFDYDYALTELQSVSNSLQIEDDLCSSLDIVSREHFLPYYESFMEVFKTDPDRIMEAILPDFWHRVTLDMASPHTHGVVLPLIGGISIEPGDMGAYTDGRTIFLPKYINYFADPVQPIDNNRNLTLYIGFALHEAAHILAGSFRFDLSFYLSKLEKPNLFKILMNAIEDYRIERFLIRIKAHPQVEDILHTMNEYFTFMNIRNPENLAMNLVFYLIDEAAKNNTLAKETEEYSKSINILLQSELYTGRFSSMKDLLEYFIERIESMDIGNPLAAYPITRELYEIIKHWPDAALASLVSPEYFPTGIHSNNNAESEFVTGADSELTLGPRRLSREELDQLYKEYNENPKEFLDRNRLPIFPELIGDKGKNLDTTSSNYSQDRLQEYVEGILAEQFIDEYEQAGTIDLSHRTKADDLIAEEQKRKKNNPKIDEKDKTDLDTKDKKAEKKKETSRKKKIYSIDPKTKSRTKLTELREFVVKDIDHFYLKKFSKWKYISQQVFRELSNLLPLIQESHDTSAFDGELNMELLIEILSDKSKTGLVEFLDIYQETSYSLDVVIGLDISGSTDLLIQNIDRVGVTQTVNGLPVMQLELTYEEQLKYDTILDIEKAFAMIFAEALMYLTKNVNIYAFNSVTSTNVYKAASIEAVSSFVSDAANRDGDFIRYINSILSTSKADMKYFYMITDGKPSADNYYGREALDDTLIAMREVVNSGVKLIYFNIDFEKQDYFETFQEEATYARYFQTPEDLLPIIPEMVRTIVKSVF